MSVLALFRRNSESQALVQAPSADLIRPDNELVIPEPEEIQCLMSNEELAEYEKLIEESKFCPNNIALQIEQIRHHLKSLGFTNYPITKVSGLMDNQIKQIQAQENKSKKINKPDIWWVWIKIEDYPHFIPSKVITDIKQIGTKVTFFISDIVEVTERDYTTYENTNQYIKEYKRIISKHLTEICFLRIDIGEPNTIKEDDLVILAWKGPTCHDEEVFK